MALSFSLDRFEQLVYTRSYDQAALQLIGALALLSHKRGELDGDFQASCVPGLPADLQRKQFYSRLVSATSTLFADPGFQPQHEFLRLLFTLHEWLGLLFSAAGPGNADHIARYLNPRGEADQQFLPGDRHTEKLCLLYSNESELELDFAALWSRDKMLAANLALALLAPVFQGSATAHGKREALLEWLPGKLRQIDDLDALPTAVLHNAYMFCSYADTPQRHAIKQDIDVLVRRKLDQLGLTDLPTSTPMPAATPQTQNKPRRKKPLMVVVLEWFSGAHSIYRTHSRTLEAAREHFEVIAFGFGYAVDEVGRAVFDRFIELEQPDYIGECMRTIREFAAEHQPDVLYMPSVGMFVLTVFMSNLRIAPLQIAGLGHPATTHSECIDYISVEEDYVGDPACFSERLMKLPKNGQPYRPSVALPDIVAQIPPRRDTLQVIVTASAMKLNPGFLDACREIRARAATPVELHFMTGLPSGLSFDRMREVIKLAVPGAIVHSFHDYAAYLTRVNQADLYISPFPFGNTNGIVDALTLGLPGVCKRGAEVFERIDGALFERVGMPSWNVADSVDAYIAAAVRLIDQHEERIALRQRLIDTQAVQRCFEGQPQAFGKNVLKLVRENKSRHAKVTA
ncbi:glycosyl transferase family 1 [Paraburkholderia fungorum]|uniref:glycosyl transferase family 1 n=1 Tax=Paraburkholderia fungorum TaxID=134537 RepID=UPI0038B8B419